MMRREKYRIRRRFGFWVLWAPHATIPASVHLTLRGAFTGATIHARGVALDAASLGLPMTEQQAAAAVNRLDIDTHPAYGGA